MKYLTILLVLVSTISCTIADPSPSYEPPTPVKTTLMHKARYYLGMDETRHRELMKAIMGVDPVTTEWCAAFVNMILLENRLPTSESVSEHYLLARSFLEYGEEVIEPEAGDIVIFPRGDTDWQGHVGFYVETVESNGITYYKILGGNQDDSVNVTNYRADKAIGIRRAAEFVWDYYNPFPH